MTHFTEFDEFGADAEVLTAAADSITTFLRESPLSKDTKADMLEKFRDVLDNLADEVEDESDDESEDEDEAVDGDDESAEEKAEHETAGSANLEDDDGDSDW